MKKNILSTIGLTAFFATAIIIASSLGNEGTHSVYAYTGGSPGQKTGSPGDGSTSNCTGCHTGTINSGNGTGAITAKGLAGGYVPGQTYTITGK